jgi:hypothetical protein
MENVKKLIIFLPIACLLSREAQQIIRLDLARTDPLSPAPKTASES